MMGKKKPAENLETIRAAFAADGVDAASHVESEIHKAEQKRKVDKGELDSLLLLRDALKRAVNKPVRRRGPTRTTGTA